MLTLAAIRLCIRKASTSALYSMTGMFVYTMAPMTEGGNHAGK